MSSGICIIKVGFTVHLYLFGGPTSSFSSFVFTQLSVCLSWKDSVHFNCNNDYIIMCMRPLYLFVKTNFYNLKQPHRIMVICCLSRIGEFVQLTLLRLLICFLLLSTFDISIIWHH